MASQFDVTFRLCWVSKVKIHTIKYCNYVENASSFQNIITHCEMISSHADCQDPWTFSSLYVCVKVVY